MDIQKELFSLQDLKYREFNARLLPSVDKETIIGVKTPDLKKMAKAVAESDEAEAFLQSLPHKYFEENQLHAFIISGIRGFDNAMEAVEKFLPFVDNWETSDQMCVKAFAKEPMRLLDKIDVWLKSDKTYTVRFAIDLLMDHFLNDRFEAKYLFKVAAVESDEYYVNMMAAWYFATALAKQYDETLPLFEQNKIGEWVHNKAIQKARESRRVTDEHKEELKKLIRR